MFKVGFSMKNKTTATNTLKVLKALSIGIRPQDISVININTYLEEGLNKKTNHCPYLSTIGQNNITCTLNFKRMNEMTFTTEKELNSFTAINCYNDFSSCLAYNRIYKEQLQEGSESYKQCAFCCNSTRQFLKVCGDNKTFCIVKKQIVEDFNTDTICNKFNCYFGGHAGDK